MNKLFNIPKDAICEHDDSNNIYTYYKYEEECFVETVYAPDLVNTKDIFFKQTKYNDKNKKIKKNLMLICNNSTELCTFDELERIIYYKKCGNSKEKNIEKAFVYGKKAEDGYNGDNIIVRLSNASASSAIETENKKQIYFNINDKKLKEWKQLIKKSQ